MSSLPYTTEQQKAIDARGTNVLVTASAGSGKTHTMLARVMALIDEGIGVQDILMVTYTNASAAEMRERLETELRKRIAAEPRADKKRAYIAELDKLPFADIGTVHAFCLHLLQSGGLSLGIDSATRIATENEATGLRNTAYEELRDKCIAARDDTFIRMYRGFIRGRRDESFRLFITEKLYGFLRSLPDCDRYIKDIATAGYTQDILSGKLALVLLNDYKKTADYMYERLTQLRDTTFADGANGDYIDRIIAVTDVIRRATHLAELSAVQTIELKGKITNYPDRMSECAMLKALHGYAKALCEEMTLLFADSDEKVAALLASRPLVERMLSFEQQFIAEYTIAKQRAGVLDFSDLEHYVVDLLADDEYAESVARRFKYIFVDEYQDINPLQEHILVRISRDNLFMVGDAKQSIYRFRQTDPTILMNKYRAYRANSGAGQGIELNVNFRSGKNILDFANTVFSELMTQENGGVDYVHECMLQAGVAIPIEPAFEQVEVCLIPRSGNTRGEEPTSVYSVSADTDTTESDKRNAMMEAEYVYKKIQALLSDCRIMDGEKKTARPVEYRDITILYASRSSQVKRILNLLTSMGLPISLGEVEAGEPSPETQEIIDYFRVLNNRYCDAPLVCVMLSVFGGFSYEEAAQIKIECGERDFFYNAVLRRSQQDDDLGVKIRDFLVRIDNAAVAASSKTIYDIAEEYVTETCMRARLRDIEDSTLRCNLLTNFLSALADSPYNDLYDYLNYFDHDTSGDCYSYRGAGSENSITVSTVHSSKGLEYNIVFLIDCCSKGVKVASGGIVWNSEYGVTMPITDPDTKTEQDNVLHHLIVSNLEREEREELIRRMYVALTRAKRHMYISGCVSVAQDKPPFGETYIHKPMSYFDMLNNVRYAKPDFDKYIVHHSVYNGTFDNAGQTAQGAQISLRRDDLTRLSEYEYPFESSVTLSNKYSVTTLKNFIPVPSVSDEDTDSAIAEENFMHTKSICDGGSVSPEVGTAYHRVMELIDFSLRDIDHVKQAIADMVSAGQLDVTAAQLVDAEIVCDTLNLDIMQYGARCRTLREQEFYMRIPASDTGLATTDDYVLVQGIIDLVIDGEQRILVDYKCSNRAPSDIRDTYTEQLHLYRRALEAFDGIPVAKAYLLVLNRGLLIEIE